MHQDCLAAMPEEGCGLLAGRILQEGYQAFDVIPMGNSLHSASRYRMDAEEQYKRFNEIDRMGLELVGIYHSHPAGFPYPSPIDQSEAYYPEVIYLIWGISDDGWECRGYFISDQEIEPIEILIDVKE